MRVRYKVLISCTALLGAFALGRFLSPVKIKTEVKVVEVEKKITDKDIDHNKHKETVVIEIVWPDGSKETTTKIVEDSNKKVDIVTVEDKNKISQEKREELKERRRVNLSVLGGVNVSSPLSGPVVGGHVSVDIVGPLSIGAWGMSNGTCGISAGLTL